MNDDIRRRIKHWQKKLGQNVQDQYYADTASRIDTVFGETGRKWLRIIEAKEEYDRLANAVPVGKGFLTFYDYVKEYYGIKMQIKGDELSPDYEIVDQKKYTVFLLKFNNGH